MDTEPYLVPGRTCGPCSACCQHLAIVDGEITKMPGILCKHSTPTRGCAIYERRPSVCRTFFCLWRSIPDLADAWRPDLSGIMMMPHALPPGFSGPFAVNLILTGAPDILQTTEFAGTMAGFVERGTATYLDLPGAPGMFGHQTLLNPILGSAIAARDLASVKALIWDVYTGMKNAPTRPIRDDELANARTTGGVAEAQT